MVEAHEAAFRGDKGHSGTTFLSFIRYRQNLPWTSLIEASIWGMFRCVDVTEKMLTLLFGETNLNNRLAFVSI